MSSAFFYTSTSPESTGKSFATPTRVVDSASATSLVSERQPWIIDEWFEQFLRIIVITQRWKQNLPLIEWVNSQQVDLAGKVAAGEIQEIIDELNAGHLIKFLAEWTDALNPLAGLIASLKLQMDYPNQVFRQVDGQGNRSDVYERATDISLNLSPKPDQLTKDIQQIYILMLSALQHAPPFTADLIDLAMVKMADNVQNYPVELFSVFDELSLTPTGKPAQRKELSKFEKDQKYTHVMKCLKWLRSLYVDRMLPLDWRLVKPLILAFRSSDESLGMLQTEWFKIHPELLTVQKQVLVYQAS